MTSKDAKYAYIRVENGLYPAIVTELGYESARPPRGLRVKSGKTLAELAQLAQSNSKSSEAKVDRQFFDSWATKTKKAVGPVTREDKIKALFDSRSDEEKERILGI